MGTVLESWELAGDAEFGAALNVVPYASDPEVLIVCEHASNYIPSCLNDLGLTQDVAQSHVAWDPGALGVAQALARLLPSVLVHGTISRLVYDCNRPPDAASAVPERSERYEIPGNVSLGAEDRARRVRYVHEPFFLGLAEQIEQHKDRLELMVTVHSFTPVFNGMRREVELGVLHGQDDWFAKAMMRTKSKAEGYDIRLNEPYAASDGVTYTLDAHGVANGLPNVMIEIRNDLIRSDQEQAAMAGRLADWINAAREAQP